MKNKKKVLILILIVLIAVLFTTACVDDTDKGYIVLSFVTNFDAITIPDIVLDGKTDEFMPEDPVRAGYDFMGWYYDQTFFVKFSTEDALTQDTTLYAYWVKKSGTIDPIEPPDIEDSQGIIYSEEGEYYTVTGYKGVAKEITVPGRYNGRPVTKIAASAFKNNASLEKISFGLNITEIGEEAFRGCTALKSLVAAEHSYNFLTESGLLYNRQKTTLIHAPAKAEITTLHFDLSVVNIIDYALENCVFNVEFKQNSKYTAIEGLDFAGFKGKLTVGKNILEIRQNAFNNATASIVFAAECVLKDIGMGAFDSYRGESLILPGTVKTVSPHAFNNCIAVIDLSRTGIKELSGSAFAGYAGEEFTIPASVSTIGKSAFNGSTANIKFALGSAYTTVGEQTFNNFKGVVTLPPTVSEIEKHAFYGAVGTVIFPSECSYTEVKTNSFNGFRGKVTLPASVTAIKENAFSAASATVDFAAASGYSEVETNAFNGFRGTVTLPASVTAINKNAFSEASGKVFFAEGSRYSEVAENAFGGFQGEVTFLSNVTSVQKNAFSGGKGKVYFDCEEGQVNLHYDAFFNYSGELIYLKNS